MWTSLAIPVPIDIGDREDENQEIKELRSASVQLSEPWWDVVYGYTKDEWTAFDPDAPQDPMPEPPKKRFGPGMIIPMRKRPV